MKTKILLLTGILLFSLACSLGSILPEEEAKPTAVPAQSEKRCGDGVCDGPENASTCAQDCAAPEQISNEQPSSQQPEPPHQEQEPPGPSSEPPETTADTLIGQVYVDVSVNRQDGEGSCPVSPWGVDHMDGGDYGCSPPMYWFGQRPHATAFQIVSIIPVSEGAWQITAEKPGGGAFQEASMWSDGQRVCEPVSMEGKPFAFSVEGGALDGQIALTLSAIPVEVANWTCDNGNTYSRETTLLRIGWGIAMTGDYNDLSLILEESDRIAPGEYQRVFSADTNPSPANRDHVEVTLEFNCMEQVAEGELRAVACPWEA